MRRMSSFSPSFACHSIFFSERKRTRIVVIRCPISVGCRSYVRESEGEKKKRFICQELRLLRLLLLFSQHNNDSSRISSVEYSQLFLLREHEDERSNDNRSERRQCRHAFTSPLRNFRNKSPNPLYHRAIITRHIINYI
jgi:hypothetical protein